MKSASLYGIGALTLAGLLGIACGGGGDDDGSGGTGGTTGGSGNTGGTTGGNGNTGGATTGGNGNTGGATTGGNGNTGGDGGLGGEGGEGGMGTGPSGFAVLFVPLTTENTGTDFQINFGAGTELDLSDTVVTFRMRIESDGNAGGIQVYATNGEDWGYASNYQSWTNFGDAEDFVDVTLDLASLADNPGGGMAGASGWDTFDKSAVQWLGVNVYAGDTFSGATWGDTTIYLDSITFSDGAADDITFDADLEGMAVNIYNSPIAGATATHMP